MTDRPAGTRRRFVIGAALVVVSAACLVNALITVDATRRLRGPKPENIDRRYGRLRPAMDGVASAVYVTDDGRRFVKARYATVPTVLDPAFVEPGEDRRSITSIDVNGLIEASARGPIVVLGDFDNAESRREFVGDLIGEARRRGLGLEILHRSGGVVLLRVGA